MVPKSLLNMPATFYMTTPPLLYPAAHRQLMPDLGQSSTNSCVLEDVITIDRVGPPCLKTQVSINNYT